MKSFLKAEVVIFSVLALLILVYLVIRAILVQPIHDEIATFFHFVQSGRFWPYFSDWNTNNHLLNSLLTWLSYQIFGTSPLALRLPNLIFFPVFAVFLWKIARRLHNPLLRWIWIISVLGLHVMIEFFALSRGYGISWALLLGSVWFTMGAMDNPSRKNTGFASGAIIFSVLAVLVNINSLIIIMVILTIRLLLDGRKTFYPWVIAIWITGLLFLLGVVKYLFDLQQRGRLDYGGAESFWNSSVKDLLRMLFGEFAGMVEIVVMIYCSVLFAGFVWFNIKTSSSSSRSGYRNLFHQDLIMFYLLIGNVIGFLIEHKLFGVLYPAGRTSMQLALFFTGALAFLANCFRWNSRQIALFFLPVFLLPVHFLQMVNIDKVSIENEQIPVKFLKGLCSRISGRETLPAIQGYKGRELRWAYLQYQHKTFIPAIHWSTYPDTIAEFQIVDPAKHPFWKDYYRLIDRDEVSGLILAGRKILPQYQLTSLMDNPNEQTSHDEYILIARDRYPVSIGNHYFHQYEFQIQSNVKHPIIWVVVTVFDRSNRELIYERVPLNWYDYSWKTGDQVFRTGLLVCYVPSEADYYITYFWNPHQTELRIKNLSHKLFHYLTTAGGGIYP